MYKGKRAQIWQIPPHLHPPLPKSQEILQLQNMNKISQDWFLFGHNADKKNCISILFDTNSLTEFILIFLQKTHSICWYGFSNPFRSSRVFRIIYSLLITEATDGLHKNGVYQTTNQKGKREHVFHVGDHSITYRMIQKQFGYSFNKTKTHFNWWEKSNTDDWNIYQLS